MPFFYYYDPYYWMILVPAMLIALLAQLNVSSTFNRYSRMASRRGFTGAQAAEAVLRAHGIQNVRIERVSGRLTDHYDPRSNVIRLSDAVYGSNSIASVGVAAHEAGHAVQYAVGYGPIKLRSALVPICNIGSQLSLILIVIGLLLYSQPLFGVGVLLLLAVLLIPALHSLFLVADLTLAQLGMILGLAVLPTLCIQITRIARGK